MISQTTTKKAFKIGISNDPMVIRVRIVIEIYDDNITVKYGLEEFGL